MSVRVSSSLSVSVAETLTGGEELKANKQGAGTALSATSTPAVTKQAGGIGTLSGGALTLDLTAIANQAGGSVTFSGLKVQRVYLKPLVATSNIIFTVGASNGYHLFATTGGKVELKQGEVCYFEFNESRPDVGGSTKTLDVSSSDVDATFEYLFAAG